MTKVCASNRIMKQHTSRTQYRLRTGWLSALAVKGPFTTARTAAALRGNQNNRFATARSNQTTANNSPMVRSMFMQVAPHELQLTQKGPGIADINRATTAECGEHTPGGCQLGSAAPQLGSAVCSAPARGRARRTAAFHSCKLSEDIVQIHLSEVRLQRSFCLSVNNTGWGACSALRCCNRSRSALFTDRRDDRAQHRPRRKQQCTALL